MEDAAGEGKDRGPATSQPPHSAQPAFARGEAPRARHAATTKDTRASGSSPAICPPTSASNSRSGPAAPPRAAPTVAL
ncbi:hypothetical protein [Amycolatopsis sp. CA-128772]|uniref:hypothetical protein n=1 Tax=Amycolatopsis sp. CA-128772 TaxID=2073159 RepID=UPI0011B09BC3|nr:hypothetical protein [Amycolatopsis sp. CA-128772]